MGQRPPTLHRPHSVLWWTKKRSYLVYVLRELSSVFVALTAIGTILGVHQVRQGEAAWRAVMVITASPYFSYLVLVSLAFGLLHTFTFFGAARKALIVRIGGRRVSGDALVWGHIGAWIVGTALISWLVLS